MSQARPTEAPSARPGELARPAPLWTRGFVLLCLVTGLCYASHQLVTVTLPLFVQGLGGSPVIAGLVFTSFSITSFILRPMLGRLSDKWSARGTLLSGAAILGATGLCFIVPSVWIAFITSAVRGIGWGAFSTAAAVGVALIAPQSRRGEASGYFSVATTAASAFAPALALSLLDSTGNFTLVFVMAGVAGLAAATAVKFMPKFGTGTNTFRETIALTREDMTLSAFIDRPVLLASALLVCVTMAAPVTFAFVPLHAKAVGVENIGFYFVASGLASVVARLSLGRMLDRQSRGFWLVAGYTALIAAYATFLQAHTLEVFMLAAVLNALGFSLTQPTLMAFAIDRAERGRMGRAMATFSMFYRVGEGIGAPVAGALIVLFGYSGMYIGAMTYAAAGIVVAALNWRTVGKPIMQPAGA